MKPKESIHDFLLKHEEKKPVSFHMPGHKGQAFYRDHGFGLFLDKMMSCDITEISGADNLFQPEGIIRRTMDRYKALYDVERSYLLINGSSGGIIAGILASVSKGGKLIMARNCHKSVFNALLLGDISPVYAYPQMIEACGIAGSVSAEEIVRCMEENPEAEAVILPSPNYYGICSDIKEIAKEVHRREKVLIVDQAHGAHLKFFQNWADGFPEPAENQGADLVINSIHKTLGSFTQTGVLNICTDRIDYPRLENWLQVMESSSPSYLLMASLDMNAQILETEGAELIRSWAADIKFFYEAAGRIPGLKIMQHAALDKTKLNLDMSAYGLDGNQLEQILAEKGIFLELVSGNITMGMTGIGNKRCDYERLLKTLSEIADTHVLHEKIAVAEPAVMNRRLVIERLPERSERIPLRQADQRVCALSVIPYPPGIPLVCPGEVFDKEVITYIKTLREKGEKVIGLDEEGCVLVGSRVVSNL